jgi:hypothetical protein
LRDKLCICFSVPTRPAGLEPATFGFEVREAEKVKGYISYSYKFAENELTGNPIQKSVKIQQPLINIIVRWETLPENVKSAIQLLVEGNADEK